MTACKRNFKIGYWHEEGEYMQTIHAAREQMPNEEKKTLENLPRQINETEKAIQEVESATSVLPIVDEEGHSECPFAPELYEQKEKAVRKLEERLSCLQGNMSLMDKEVDRCRANLDRIRSDGESLSNPEAKKEYVGAEGVQMHDYLVAIERRKHARFVLRKAELVLERARSKKFPCADSQQDSSDEHTCEEDSGREERPVHSNGTVDDGEAKLSDEVRDIISIGRLGQSLTF